MDQQADPLAPLADRSKWFVRPRVCFEPHTRRNPDGTVHYEVTAADLAEIAANGRRLQDRQRVVARVTDGHLDLSLPEALQPELLGYGLNQRTGKKFDGTPAVLIDLYVKPAKVPTYEQRPYLSVEYRWKSKEIRGVALLLRDPALDLGTSVYHDDADTVYYSLPLETAAMAEETQEPPFTPEEERNGERMYRYMCSKYAWMSHCSKKYENGEPAAPSTPTSTNVAVPGGEKEKEKDMTTTPMSSPEQVISYAALQAEVAELKRRDAEREAAVQTERCARLLDQLKNVELYEFDYSRELKTLVPMTDADRLAQLEYIRKHYRRKSGSGDTVDYMRGPIPSQQPQREPDQTTPEQERAAVSLATRKGITYDEALAEVKAK